MKDWRQFLAKRIVIEEYYISLPTAYDIFQFKVRYVKHNGYTRIEFLPDTDRSLTIFAVKFIDWFGLRSDFNTRYDQPHWWHPVRWNRKKKITVWAINSVNRAYNEFKKEIVDKTIDE